jgi:D-alanine--poly(phosphoribitol) ligase subunit 2
MSNSHLSPEAIAGAISVGGSDLTESTIKKYLCQHFLVEFSANTNADTDLFEQGFIDSYGYVELVNFLEKQFQIRFTDEELISRELRSLNTIVAMVGKKLNGN